MVEVERIYEIKPNRFIKTNIEYTNSVVKVVFGIMFGVAVIIMMIVVHHNSCGGYGHSHSSNQSSGGCIGSHYDYSYCHGYNHLVFVVVIIVVIVIFTTIDARTSCIFLLDTKSIHFLGQVFPSPQCKNKKNFCTVSC